MKTCPYCKEQVQEEAVKCRYCQSMLLSGLVAPDKPEERSVTYVVDRGLITFAKFTGGVLAVFLVSGAFLFGFKLENSVERVEKLQEEAKATAKDLEASKAELEAAKKSVATLKTDVQKLLDEAKLILKDMARNKEESTAILTEHRELTPKQRETLAEVKSSEPGKVRGDYKYWATGATIRIRFLGGTPKDQAAVKADAAEWLKYANLNFQYVAAGEADVRIAFRPNEGSWSFVGTDALAIPQKEATMNLGWMERNNTLHQFGHVLGLIEEHTNPKANIKWDVAALKKELMGAPNFWDEATLRKNVLAKTPQDEVGPYREFDPRSVMTYTFDPKLTGGVPLGGGSELSESDKALARKLYPGR
jgi:hypothetical protein